MITSIPKQNLADLEASVTRLAKIANRLGCSPVTLTVLEEELREVVDSITAFKTYTTWVKIEVTGEAPRIPGWSLLAAIEPFETGNLVLILEGKEGDFSEYRNTPIRCDHCMINRRRNKAYIVQETATGKTAMVGSTCLEHYTGHANPPGNRKSTRNHCNYLQSGI